MKRNYKGLRRRLPAEPIQYFYTMYSAKVLEHLESPRNVGEMVDATVCGEATNPVCGDLLHLYLKVVDGKIASSSFQVQGCPPSIAAGSVLTELITGISPEEARQLKPQDITRALGTLPRNKEHCSVLAIDALRNALAKIQSDVV
jgi:nitrogen fixation NifU-like protein